MSSSFFDTPPESGAEKQVRECRYGHGPLTLIDKFGGKPVVFSMFFSVPDQSPMATNQFGPFHYYVCSHCGYTEFVDTTPSVSIQHREHE